MIIQYCNIEALKLDHWDQEIQCFGLIGFRHLHRKWREELRTITCIWYVWSNLCIMFRLTLKFGLHRVSRTDQRRKSRTPCTVVIVYSKISTSVFEIRPHRLYPYYRMELKLCREWIRCIYRVSIKSVCTLHLKCTRTLWTPCISQM